MLYGLSVYMKMNQKASIWNNEDRNQRRISKSIFLNKPYIVDDLRWGLNSSGIHIRFQIEYVPIWIKEQSYRKNSVQLLPIVDNQKGRNGTKYYGKWLDKHPSEPDIDKMLTNTAVVLEELIYTNNHVTTIKTFSTYNDLVNELITEIKQHRFLQRQIR